VAFLVVHAQDDHADLGVGTHELAGGRQAIHDGHVDVHEDHVGLLLQADALDLQAIGGLANDADAALQLEECLQPLAEQLVVIGKHDPNVIGGAARSLSLGIHR
jgi:hypothetical protein